jgi:hypothetical protein
LKNIFAGSAPSGEGTPVSSYEKVRLALVNISPQNPYQILLKNEVLNCFVKIGNGICIFFLWDVFLMLIFL